jgi:CheY-like chemotaxis protein
MTDFCILQVEDNAQDVFLQQRAFEQVGISNYVRVVTDGQQAINYLAGKDPFSDRQKHPLPLMVLLKVKLPREPGFEVLQWIRAQPSLRALVVILLGEWQQPSDVARAYELGANSCALQPRELPGWVEMARSLKSWWLEHNQFAPVHRTGWRTAGADIRATPG